MNEIGVLGEALSVDYLKSKSYKILLTNYSMPRWGEIDIIAIDGNEIVFVEVKTRTSDRFGDPLEAITPHKLKALRRTINYFLTHEGREYLDCPQRIDVIGIELDRASKKLKNLSHLKI